MAKTIKVTVKMMQGLNYQYGAHLVLSESKFFGSEGKPITMYIVKDCYREKDGRFQDDELFRSTSLIYICYFMRELMFSMRGEDVPPIEGELAEKWEYMRERRGVEKSVKFMKEKYGHELQDSIDR